MYFNAYFYDTFAIYVCNRQEEQYLLCVEAAMIWNKTGVEDYTSNRLQERFSKYGDGMKPDAPGL